MSNTDSTPAPIEWTIVSESQVQITHAAAVPGGWLYRTVEINREGSDAVALAFVPRPAA